MAFTLFPGGPDLPPFRSLLVQGHHHPSAPIHLLLSLAPRQHFRPVIFITSNRALLHSALVNLNDKWLAENAGKGCHARVLSATTVLSPPTPEHCLALISSLRAASTVHDEDLHPKLDLIAPPSLIILHELSAFFLSEPVAGHETESQHPPSSLLPLIAQTLDTAANFAHPHRGEGGSQITRVAMFDSRIKSLTFTFHPPTTPVKNEEEEEEKREDMRYLLHHYFDLICTVDDAFITLDSTTRRMHLSQPQVDAPALIWNWAESRPASAISGHPPDTAGTIFAMIPTD